jgi:nitroreductase
MDVITAIRTEPVVSKFVVQPVADKIIRKIVESGLRAHRNQTSQVWRFIVIRDLDKLRALSECFRYNGHVAEAAFIVIPVTVDLDLIVEGQICAYMQLAAWDSGLGSCMAPIIYPQRLRMLLHIPENQFLNTAISFGLPRQRSAKGKTTQKLPLENVVRWEHW